MASKQSRVERFKVVILRRLSKETELMEASMRADRLLSIMLLLQARGKLRADELADELEVSVRTIYRDIDALSMAGVPIYTQSGTGGGCYLDLDFIHFRQHSIKRPRDHAKHQQK